MARVAFPVLFGLIGCAILIGLGIWQMQRLSWKTEMLARIDARIVAEPQPLPSAPILDRDQYLPVEVNGTLTGDPVFVLQGVTGQTPSFRVIIPLQLAGREILADIGAIPEEAKPGFTASGPIHITGNLHWPDERTSWTPEPDMTSRTWFARDVELLASELGTEEVMIVARRHDRPDLGATPMPVGRAGIPNDHLGYAVTWFGLALVWAVMSALLIRRTQRIN